MSDFILPRTYTADDSFDEVLFPTDISYGAEGGPEYSTDIITTASGGEQRNQNHAYGRYKANVAHGVKDIKDIRALDAFFRCRSGRAYGFRYKDHKDFKAVNQTIGTVEANGDKMQLLKRYTSGPRTEIRIIRKPVEGTVIIYADGVRITTGFTLEIKSGSLTITSATLVGKVITADFEFDVPVRFTADYIPQVIDDYNSYSMPEIGLIEVKV
ncbi:MAG: DUF2460 domain-containing protein [Negativicutes bacterium]